MLTHLGHTVVIMWRHLWLPVTFAEAALILNDIVVYSNAAVLESIQSSLGRTADHCLPPD